MSLSLGETVARTAEKENEMLYSNARISRRARRWAWANRPQDSIDNPVKRYLRNRPVAANPWAERFRRALERMALRPAY